MTRNISEALLASVLPNADPIEFGGSQLRNSVQKATPKIVSQLFSTQTGTVSTDPSTKPNTMVSFDSSYSNA